MILKDKIENLQKGEVIIVQGNPDYIKAIKYIGLQLNSYQSLFNSYINNTCEEANKFNLDLFLEKNVQLTAQKEALIDLTLKEALGEQNYNLLNELYIFVYKIDDISDYITFTIMNVKEA